MMVQPAPSCPVVGERAVPTPTPRSAALTTRDATTQCGPTEASVGEVDGLVRMIDEAEARSERFLRKLGCSTMSVSDLSTNHKEEQPAIVPRRAHPLVPVFGNNWPGSGPAPTVTAVPALQTPTCTSVGSMVYVHSGTPSMVSVRTLPSMNFSDSPSCSMQSTPRDIQAQLEGCGARPCTPPFRRPVNHMSSIMQLLGGPTPRSVMVHHTMGAAAVSFLFEKLLTACTQKLFPEAMVVSPPLVTTPTLWDCGPFGTPPQSPSPHRGARQDSDYVEAEVSKFSTFQVVHMDSL